MAEAAPVAVASAPAPGADARTRTLSHDFGVLRPAVAVTHTFRVSNPSAAAWTFERFDVTCGCTVTDISAEVIPPGGSADAVFAYKPPAEPADDHRSVGLAFREPAALAVRLAVTARVRHPLSVFPVKLRLARLPHGKPHVERVEVENTSGQELPPPKLAGSAPWLRVGEPEPLPAGQPGLTQKWAVPVTVRTDGLLPGEHVGELLAAPGQPHPEGLRLPVTAQVVPPLDPSPSQLFFGRVPVGRPGTVLFAVRLPAGVAPDSLTLSHDLGPLLTSERTGTEPGRATFTATLTPAAVGMVRGTVRVRCSDPAVPETTLPVMAMGVADAK